MTAPQTPRVKTPAPFKTPEWERDVSVSVGHVMRHTAPLLRVKDGTGTKLTSSDPLDAPSYKVGGTQVVGAQGAAVANGVNAVAAPTQAEFNALVTQFNLLLARCRAHGLIAT